MKRERELAIEMAAQALEAHLGVHQAESIPLIRPLLLATARREEEGALPTPELQLVGELAGFYCTALHGVLLQGARVNLPELRAHLNDLLDETEALIPLHTPALIDEELLFLPRSAGEAN